MPPILCLLLMFILNVETAHAEAALSKTTFDKVELATKKEAFPSNRKRIKKKGKWFQLFKKKKKIKQKTETNPDDIIFWSGLLAILLPFFALIATPLFFFTFSLFFALVAYGFAKNQRRKGRRNFKINFGFAMSIIVLSTVLFSLILLFIVIIIAIFSFS